MKIKKTLLLTMTVIVLLAACSTKQDAVQQLPNKIPVTIQILDKGGKYSKFFVHIAAKGYQTKEIAYVPKDKTMIVTKKQFTLNLYTGITYTFQVSPTTYDTIDEYLTAKKSSGSTNEGENLPISKIQFTPSLKNNKFTISIE
ncbi:hypothetical protein [Parageobacillus thermoglucosidasius]|uniref:Lipoprotein n=1 Tax=Parageobacillus thermoglucosidasius TaxID=1426 RepID=A0AAN0YPS4_PARTM|nr:hypothetical protein [Parageobacillus thermoglucosidasius]ALF10244.1 hypothetical protein AOT13_09565 [Parageobacillus thermoglucosidasius]ANZ30326.1 hypothetical protein BCV53_09575 [Parageobacillus thermoglucosidasius]APM81064.1 hypothetical protein BCV54_09580 [Parageobacillus thermoglucosidasius]KJX70778.1 hypothetical protein WH82_01265 [Parageobacillus thermoglucosidasius]RDE21654.1 hypothetical protein DV712_16215 [Parageobacillus thermoglucosidasius]